MTLNVTSTEIQIKNSIGQIKFTSNNRLVSLKDYGTGTIYCGNSYGQYISTPFVSVGTNDFLVLTVKITYCTGQLGQNLLNIEIPANSPIITNYYGRALNNKKAADQDMLVINIIGSNIVAKTYKIDYQGSTTNSTIDTAFNYKAYLYTYL